LQSAGTPLKFDVKGNRIAFIGCNAVGPDADLATDTSPGSNPCDMSKMKMQITELKSEGYNPIVTFQHMEVCQPDPEPPQRGDFLKAVQAGAVIVSGSQAHCPQIYEFIGNTFVHYGLGNLFFDQMDKIERMAFIDQYLFYDNRLLGVNPIGMIRVDEAQPQLMTGEELQNFIDKYYSALNQKR
jgi:poly-gamma-glutamate capsule biosynthesis protein CapA/YwtB (metallophosphatase superfamily)